MRTHPYCDRLRRHFDALLDGQLSSFLRRVVEQHLGGCGPCREDLTLQRLTVEAVRQKAAPDVPPRVLKRIIRACQDSGEGGLPSPLRPSGDWDGIPQT